MDRRTKHWTGKKLREQMSSKIIDSYTLRMGEDTRVDTYFDKYVNTHV